MKRRELSKILRNHKHWLNEDCEGWENMRARLREADLSGIDLRGADLREADLRGANLCTTNLYKVDLSGADLREVDLYNADLCEVDLFDAKLFTADNIPFFPCACPDFGMFIGYKTAHEYIVELEIPEDAKRVSATTRRCRCNKAKVLRILNQDRTVADITEVRSDYDSSFVYKVGEIVSVDNFNEDRWDECSTGIHFFINFQEAVNNGK